MIVLVAVVLLVLLVGAAVVVAAAGTASSSDGDGEGAGWSAAVIVPAVGAGVVVLLVVVVLGIGGLRSVVDAGGPGEEVVEDVAEQVPEPTPEDAGEADDEPVAVAGSPATYEGRVAVDAAASPLRPPPMVDGLAAGDVVEVRATGFLEHAEGVVAQCDRAEAAVCRNVVPIVTDGDGRVRVPYRLVEDGPVLVVEVDLARGRAQLAFGSPPSRPVLSMRGERTVDIRNAVPGEAVTLRRCDPDAAGLDECETVGRPIAVAADGTASAAVGGPARGGSLLVLTGRDGGVLAEPLRLDAAPAATVDLDPTQLLVGLGTALLLIGVAVVLIRTTDWRVPAEAATPFLDAAPLEG